MPIRALLLVPALRDVDEDLPRVLRCALEGSAFARALIAAELKRLKRPDLARMVGEVLEATQQTESAELC